MKDYTVENPVFSEKISIVEEEDLVSAENDTAAAKQLIQNDLVLSKRMKQCLGDAPEHGDSKDLVITFESGDEESVDGWTDVPVMQNVEDHKTIFRKISNMVKNVRYLYKLLGTTDISGCGADTVTGAIKKLSERKIPNVTRSASVTQEGQQALDAVEKNAAVSGTIAYDLAQINSNLFVKIQKLSRQRVIKSFAHAAYVDCFCFSPSKDSIVSVNVMVSLTPLSNLNGSAMLQLYGINADDNYVNTVNCLNPYTNSIGSLQLQIEKKFLAKANATYIIRLNQANTQNISANLTIDLFSNVEWLLP